MKVADDPSGETGCSTNGIDSQLVILWITRSLKYPKTLELKTQVHPKVRNHGEGPCQGLVESACQRVHIYKTLLRCRRKYQKGQAAIRHYANPYAMLSLMTFASASQFHIYLLWINACLAQCLNSVLNAKVIVRSFSMMMLTFVQPSFQALKDSHFSVGLPDTRRAAGGA